MGLAKDLMMQQWEQGWSSIDKAVCPECLTDEALADVAAVALRAPRCNYCGRQTGQGGALAAPVDAVIEAVVGGLRSEYGTRTTRAWAGARRRAAT